MKSKPALRLNEIQRNVVESARIIRSKTTIRPKIGIILGSGLGEFGESLSRKKSIENSSVPHYPVSTIEGHHGRLIFGKLHGKSLIVFQGRVHFYESGDIEQVLYPIRVAHRLGVRTLLLTNAAGGVNRSFRPGDLMVITDHLNLTFENPVSDPTPQIHCGVYDAKLQEIINAIGRKQNIDLREGVYCGIKGPSYETAAEVEMVRRLGGDAVGMSTVNEASFARSLGMRIAGISCITNLSTGILPRKLSHDEVTEVANRVKKTFRSLLEGIVREL